MQRTRRRTLLGRGVAISSAVPLIFLGLSLPAISEVESTVSVRAEVLAGEQIVALSLPSSGAEHLVVDDRSNRVLWRGRESVSRIPLAYATSTDLVLAEITAAGVRPVAEVLATNPAPASQLTPLTSVVTTAGTSLTWGAVAGSTSYQVTSGQPDSGQQVANPRRAAITLPTRLGQSGRYEITSDTVQEAVPGQAGRSVSNTYRYGVQVTPPDTAVTKISPTARVGDVVPRALAETIQTDNSYETFIPMQYVDAPETSIGFPCEGGADWWYSGDNRGVGWHTGKYRTQASANMLWLTHGSLPVKNVSPTNRYALRDGKYVYDSTRTASGDDLNLRMLSNDGQYARNVIEHEVGNPYCSSLVGITYASQQDVYKNGGHWIYGAHDKMPDHQFYRDDFIQDDPNDPGSPIREEITLVFHHPLVDPACLFAPVCGSWRYQYVR